MGEGLSRPVAPKWAWLRCRGYLGGAAPPVRVWFRSSEAHRNSAIWVSSGSLRPNLCIDKWTSAMYTLYGQNETLVRMIAVTTKLDPNSRIPLYVQIRNQFLAKIEKGRSEERRV